MAEIVQPRRWQPHLESQLVEVVTDLLRMQRPADLVGEDETAGRPRLARSQPLGGLPLAVCAQRADSV
ncbi:hypothetical protein FE391_30895 [Nonomuraea sp. KC401]|uniref:hypothetical protein n=1 Tax=unclassified Nonomuraea TaxID=2593643 RepID=UPI0010FF3F67|nr:MULTISPECIES: hypothetical protein [unclassified Nonomuraea]NBE97949.1 hypothetical protein [Nonomuraea sp. K271]TLF61964.1 hypothetical protein FE391_30895 [Nonomuraea sp. KC401]